MQFWINNCIRLKKSGCKFIAENKISLDVASLPLQEYNIIDITHATNFVGVKHKDSHHSMPHHKVASFDLLWGTCRVKTRVACWKMKTVFHNCWASIQCGHSTSQKEVYFLAIHQGGWSCFAWNSMDCTFNNPTLPLMTFIQFFFCFQLKSMFYSLCYISWCCSNGACNQIYSSNDGIWLWRGMLSFQNTQYALMMISWNRKNGCVYKVKLHWDVSWPIRKVSTCLLLISVIYWTMEMLVMEHVLWALRM